ncbi:hypothetical protein RclHR1_13870001 [Rhizophagus clarus]|uniref:Uncharacterized protein n=1 Tax=Rhizophagus clarus TaxID=94130 RepID=A0A2Z6R3P6_9GLOM|nr:hypothetical protein RclHR1_13870001 [Rhizophagus clarus]
MPSDGDICLNGTKFHELIYFELTLPHGKICFVEECNPYDQILQKLTSRKLSKFCAWQRKAMNNALPTMDILQQRYPTIINQRIACWTCSSYVETNNLLWLCLTHLEILRPHIVTFAKQLSDTCDNGDFFIEQDINNNKIFQFSLTPTNTYDTKSVLPNVQTDYYYRVCFPISWKIQT